jgi:multiple sugar transport system ATP-binding protein
MIEIKLENITKVYTGGTKAVDSASFNINKGEFVVLVGPSGCGKTSILRMIAGLEDISSGNLYFDGKIINNLPPNERSVGMVFQNYALYPHLSVYDNLAFPLKIKKVNKSEIKTQVEKIAQIIGLSEDINKKPKQLSGGQRQRVALGRALIRKPDVFLFDEPLSNLDAKLRVQMRTEIIQLHREFGTSSVYVTHDQTEAMTMGDRIVVMNGGKINQIDTPQKIYDYPSDIFTAQFIGSPQMNFFDATSIQNQSIKLIDNNFDIHLQSELKSDSDDVKTCGIRPEDIILSDSDSDSFKIKVLNVEYLGFEQLIYFDFLGSLKAIRYNLDKQILPNDIINIKFDNSKLHLFNTNGNRVN